LGKRVRALNLNNYVQVETEEEATLKIIPHVNKDGTQLPPMFFLGIKSKRFEVTIENMSSTVWHPAIIIDSETCSPEDYIKMVDWWFEKARENEDYVEMLADTFKNLRNHSDDIRKAMAWLKTTSAYNLTGRGKYAKRKKEVGKFLMNWLNRAVDFESQRKPQR
jgi:hypothetical protein